MISAPIKVYDQKVNFCRHGWDTEHLHAYHLGSFTLIPRASSLPEGINTLQFSTRAHIENALAIGPKVP